MQEFLQLNHVQKIFISQHLSVAQVGPSYELSHVYHISF